MAEVARAWEGSAALRQWREGFHPLQDLIRVPDGAFRNAEDKRAYLERNFTLRTELPSAAPPPGRITWSDGSSLPVTPLSAPDTYRLVDRDPDRAGGLVVTAARLGELTLDTSRGPARVPAWLFTLEGYGTPLARVAVGPDRLPAPPIGPASEYAHGSGSLSGHTAASPEAARFTVIAARGSCEEVGIEVLEGADTVVLAAGTRPRGRSGDVCDAALRTEEVPVELSRPLGSRILLDAASGAPVPFYSGAGPR
ncbi:hypothetical protein DEJ50_09885 [Streptomyces venezuelae]|uniref:Uncharacterized protein n=2 Tax=Streptomyces venezuelae TaxID=54571 RepID=A0A5P2CYW5_STRVZ|nr:hypothetical protein DEJ50_09885 [Streptomyces venezuelae]